MAISILLGTGSGAYKFCPTFTQNKSDLIAYFTRIKEMDRVGFEPTHKACFYNDLVIVSAGILR
jgi:hypothetical protein